MAPFLIFTGNAQIPWRPKECHRDIIDNFIPMDVMDWPSICFFYNSRSMCAKHRLGLSYEWHAPANWHGYRRPVWREAGFSVNVSGITGRVKADNTRLCISHWWFDCGAPDSWHWLVPESTAVNACVAQSIMPTSNMTDGLQEYYIHSTGLYIRGNR